jgi:DNA adenine methylase
LDQIVAFRPPTRPALRWHGGKWKLAPWIISHFPPHRIYVEPYGGAASVLLRKVPSFSEIYNDLDDSVVNLFKVLREPLTAARLVQVLELTPFSRREFERSYEPAAETIEAARRLIVRSFQGFGSDAPSAPKTGFRAQSPKSGRSPEKDWLNYAPALKAVAERLREVVIECRPAPGVMRRHDAVDTLHYVDPPYLWETRSTKRAKGERYHAYAHELDDQAHEDLLELLPSLKGMVVLSGYPAPLYDDALTGWRRVTMAAHADGGRDRTEVLWINPQACAGLDAAKSQHDMFAASPAVSNGECK